MKNGGLTTISFPAFSGLFAILIAAAAAAPEEIPTCILELKHQNKRQDPTTSITL